MFAAVFPSPAPPPVPLVPLMIGPLGMQEMLIILVVALIVFGPRKLPQIGKTLGKSIAEFRRTSTELRSTLEREVQIEEFRAARSDLSGLGKEVTDADSGRDSAGGPGSAASGPEKAPPESAAPPAAESPAADSSPPGTPSPENAAEAAPAASAPDPGDGAGNAPADASSSDAEAPPKAGPTPSA